MATGGSSSPISVTVDDPTSTYSNPTRGPSGVNVFSTTSGSSTATYAELRLGREELEREKLRLEVLKLRIDLRQLVQQLQLPEIARELEEVAVSTPSVVVPPCVYRKPYPS
ncbi:hypothetical protein [Bradyrhizobium sp. AZCC 2289]|uniref:hypothetical protein n=1 Tax=Bradyrhizobium sp. AZCC 2289 TaxID=3117026 RepID=UPI002FEFD75A